jgi:hypothetical protein
MIVELADAGTTAGTAGTAGREGRAGLIGLADFLAVFFFNGFFGIAGESIAFPYSIVRAIVLVLRIFLAFEGPMKS